MENKICCFAGHRSIADKYDLSVQIYEKCEKLICQCGVKTFWVGNYGSFDTLAAGIVRKLKSKYSDIELDLFLPYVTKTINEYREMYYKEYDHMIIADMPENTPVRYRILKCNQFMIEQSDFLIAYVNHSFGGAAKTLEYARKKKQIEIFNFGTG